MKVINMSNTIHWYKVKCSLYKQEFGVHLWKDLVAFIDKHIGFDYTIEGQTSPRFEGVEAYYEDGEIKHTKDYIDKYKDMYEEIH